MATIKQAVTLLHRSDLGEETIEVAFEAGDRVTVLKEWDDRLLCKDGEGRLFNIPKNQIDSESD